MLPADVSDKRFSDTAKRDAKRHNLSSLSRSLACAATPKNKGHKERSISSEYLTFNLIWLYMTLITALIYKRIQLFCY
jgi:hypothetical protein